MQDYLPDDHLARFVVDLVEQLDVGHLSAVYSGRGSKPFHPALLVALLFCKRMGIYRIDPTYSGLPFLNSAAVIRTEPAPI